MWGTQAIAVGGIGMVPYVREVAGGAISGFGVQVGPIQTVMAAPAEFVSQSMQGDLDEAWQRSLWEVTAFAFKAPARQGWITGDFVRDYSNGDADSEGYQVIRDFFFPRPRERNRR